MSSQVGAEVLQRMVAGNKDGKDASFLGRTGAFGQRVSKGNLWEMQLGPRGRLAGNLFPTLLGGGTSDSASDKGYEVGPLKGTGGRMTIGAKSMRYELVLWCDSATRAAENAKKWNESELAKGDEGTPPTWWKTFIQEVIADRGLGPQVSSALGFSASGELFLAKTEIDVKKSQEKLPGWAGRFDPKPAKP